MKTFEECILGIGANYFATQEFIDFAVGWQDSLGYAEEVEYLHFFEEEYECSGICEEALFSFSRSVELGKPKSCFQPIKDEVRDRMWWLGVSTAGSGILLLILFIFQYCLW